MDKCGFLGGQRGLVLLYLETIQSFLGGNGLANACYIDSGPVCLCLINFFYR